MSQYTVWYYVSSSRENGVDKILTINPSHLVEEEGKQVESDFNSKGPGESWFIYGDVTKESDIKVIIEVAWFIIVLEIMEMHVITKSTYLYVLQFF